MGTYVFKLPDVGEGIAEAEIVAWHVDVGAVVKEDQPLVDVMTDKATVEIGAPVSGRILWRKGEAGTMAAIGQELVVIETAEKQRASSVARAAAAEPPPAPAVEPPAPVPEATAAAAAAPQVALSSTAGIAE